MSTEHKTIDLEIKSVNEDEGTFEAVVAVFGNVDRDNDRLMKGAFDKTLLAWKSAGDAIPFVFLHKLDDPDYYIGEFDPNDVEVTDSAVFAKGKVDMENPKGVQAFKLMKRRLLKEFSFTYAPTKFKRAKDGVRDLLEIDLVEFSVVPRGANPATALLSAKSEKAEDVRAKRADRMRALLDVLDSE